MQIRSNSWVLFMLALAAVSGCTTVVDNTNDDDGGGDERYVVFTDPDNPDFSTIDVYDANDNIVRFDRVDHALLWMEDGTVYGEGTWVVDDNYIVVGRAYQIRFGTDNGVRRAYVTGQVSGTLYHAHFHPNSIDFDPTSNPLPND